MQSFYIETKKRQEIVDITTYVQKAVEKSKIKEGLCCVYVKHATCAVIVNENYDKAVCDDILDALERIIPTTKKPDWKHNAIDNNAAAHIKAAILSPSVCIPISAGKLQLGRWQGVGLVELDGPREREVIVKCIEK